MGPQGLAFTMDTSLETNLYMKLIPGAEKGLLCALLANNDFRNSLL
jgi:hypothetical protein